MRKRLIFLLATVLLAIPVTTWALTTEGRNTLLVGSDRTIEGVYLSAGGTVDLAGTFTNDVVIGGGTVEVSGPVAGDVLVAGGTVKINGEVAGNVRLVGGTLEINGKVGKNILAAGGEVIIGSKAEVAGEITVASGTFKFSGTAAQPINVWGGAVVFNGTAQSDVNLHTGDDCGEEPCVTLGPATKISGNLSYWSAVEADVAAGAVVTGTTTHHPVNLVVDRNTVDQIVSGIRWWTLFSALVVGIVISLFLPKSLRQVADLMVRRPGPAIGFGTLFLFAVPFGLLLLMVTVVGIPLAVILLGLYILALYLTQIYLGYFFGNIVLRALRKTSVAENRSTTFLATVVGMILLALVFDFMLGLQAESGLHILSFLGGLLRFGLTVWAFGGLLLWKAAYVKEQSA